jgi:hypothetical protein
MIHKPIRWIKKKFTTVMELQDDKRSIAAGVAIGFFWGFTPFVGLKTLLAFFTAWFTRTNKIAAVIAVSLHDLLLPFYPLYLTLSYHLGLALLRPENPLRVKKLLRLLAAPTTEVPEDWWTSWDHLTGFLSEAIDGYWSNLYHNLHYLYPLLLGTCILAIPFAVGTYYVTLYWIERMARHQAEKLELLRRLAEAEKAAKQAQGDSPSD